jgi:hypothetical protein
VLGTSADTSWAGLARPHPVVVADLLGELVRERARVAGALLVAHPGPRALVERLPGGLDRAIHVRRPRLGDAQEQLFAVGVEHVDHIAKIIRSGSPAQ